MTQFVTHTGYKAFVTHVGYQAILLHGTAPEPPTPGPLSVAFQLTNRTGASVGPALVSIGHAFARGDVPAGNRLVLSLADGTTRIPVQQDRESYWNDGSLKFAAIAFVAPETFADAQQRTYHLTCEIGTPNRTPSYTLAQLAADHDFRMFFYGGDIPFGESFSVYVNQVIADAPVGPNFGADPVAGVEVIKQGPICCEWRFWSYLVRDGIPAYHAWVKCNIWVRRWNATGACQVIGLATSPNCLGPHPAGTAGINDGDPPRFAANISLFDGVAIYLWGGANSPFAFDLDASAFNVAAGTITLPANPAGYPDCWPVAFDGPGTPSGLVQNSRPYFLPQQFFDQPHYLPGKHRYYVATYGRSAVTAWQADTLYSSEQVVSSNGGRYVALTSGRSGFVAPSGEDDAIVDGTVTWQCLTVPMGAAGSGACRAMPMPVVYFHCGVPLCRDDGQPVWVGSSDPQPVMVPLYDREYLFRASKLTPPYYLDIEGHPYPYPWKAYFNYPIFLWDISSTGMGPDDERIGTIQHASVNALLSDDLGWYRRIVCEALAWTDYWLHHEDERSGWPVCTDNGPDDDGTRYPYLGPCWPFGRSFRDPSFNDGLLAFTFYAPTEPGYSARYGEGAGESSHLPTLWFVPYLMTGHDVFLFLGISEASAVHISYGFRNLQIDSDTYWGLTFEGGAQIRAIAWGTKAFAQANHCIPPAHPLAPLIRKSLTTTVDYLLADRARVTRDYPDMADLGLFIGPTQSATQTQMWMWALVVEVFGVEALKGELPGWGEWLTGWHSRLTPALYDPDKGGTNYHCGAVFVSLPTSEGANPGVNTPAEVWTATYGSDFVDSPTGIANGGPPFNPSTDMEFPFFPWPATYYSVIQWAAIKMHSWLGTPGAAAVADQIDARIEGSGGIIWSGQAAAGTGSQFPSAYPVHAFAPAPPTP